MRRGMMDYQIADETHNFPEWIRNQPPEGSWKDISLHDVLSALGMEAYEERIMNEQRVCIAHQDSVSVLMSVRPA